MDKRVAARFLFSGITDRMIAEPELAVTTTVEMIVSGHAVAVAVEPGLLAVQRILSSTGGYHWSMGSDSELTASDLSLFAGASEALVVTTIQRFDPAYGVPDTAMINVVAEFPSAAAAMGAELRFKS